MWTGRTSWTAPPCHHRPAPARSSAVAPEPRRVFPLPGSATGELTVRTDQTRRDVSPAGWMSSPASPGSSVSRRDSGVTAPNTVVMAQMRRTVPLLRVSTSEPTQPVRTSRRAIRSSSNAGTRDPTEPRWPGREATDCPSLSALSTSAGGWRCRTSKFLTPELSFVTPWVSHQPTQKPRSPSIFSWSKVSLSVMRGLGSRSDL